MGTVKYFYWNNGKPRWVPGPHMRARGAKGVYLRDEAGEFLPYADAVKQAILKNAAYGVGTPRPKPSNNIGYVYFMWAANAIKIGFSVDPTGRAAALQTGSPLDIRLILAVRKHKKYERDLHRRFRELRVSGEWFRPDPVLLAFIENLQHETISAQSSHHETLDCLK